MFLFFLPVPSFPLPNLSILRRLATVAGEAAAAAAMVVYWPDGRTFRHPQLPMCSPLDFLVGLAAACFSLLVVAVILCCQKGAAQAKQKVFLLDVDFSRHLDTLLHIKLLPFHEDIFLFQSYASFEKGLLEQKNEFFPKTNSFAL